MTRITNTIHLRYPVPDRGGLSRLLPWLVLVLRLCLSWIQFFLLVLAFRFCLFFVFSSLLLGVGSWYGRVPFYIQCSVNLFFAMNKNFGYFFFQFYPAIRKKSHQPNRMNFLALSLCLYIWWDVRNDIINWFAEYFGYLCHCFRENTSILKRRIIFHLKCERLCSTISSAWGFFL